METTALQPKSLVCIVCPQGCRLTALLNNGEIEVNGNLCPKGAQFAKTELTCPMRTVTTTIPCNAKEISLVPVRTDGEVPKSAVFEIIKLCNKSRIINNVCCGDIVIENIANTGVNMVATRTVNL